ncbi:baseplate J/gp47 family protein [Pelosinus sp. UFO1]|uniref:baseplate assembly protein n=1 Tax=Pelosinus sp. UFO1 TaxID=484770 RepID=UPI0004D17A32|nr:baseplate J/gp47 family protein [Pelosinus sp. UFO1]AIF51265.1 Baseplate J family protein [Pelosinus sp. UFO1]
MAKYNLPDITFAEKDAKIIENEIIQSYEEVSEQSLAVGDPRKKLLQSEVPIIVGQRSLIDYSAKQNLLAYAVDDILDHIGILVGCTRLPAKAATSTIRFTLSVERSQPTTIEAGKRVTSGDNIFFATVSEAVIPPGTITIDSKVQCLTEGTIGNGYGIGELKTLVDPIPYVSSISNITVSEGGIDIEANDPYRDRIQQAPESFSTAGPDGAYIYWAKTASSTIIDVEVYSPSPGVVHICPLVTGGEIPGQEILDAVLAICSDKKVRPLTDNTYAVAPEQVEYTIDVSYWIDKQNENLASSIRTKVNQSVSDYRTWQKSKLGRGIDPSELIKVMKNAGAKRVAVATPIYQALNKNQVAKEQENITVNYGGIEE